MSYIESLLQDWPADDPDMERVWPINPPCAPDEPLDEPGRPTF